MIKKKEILYYSFFLSAFLLPLSIKLSNFAVGLSLVLVLINLKSWDYIKKQQSLFLLMSTAIFFLGYLFSTLVHGFSNDTVIFLSKRVVFLCIPVLILLINGDDICQIKKNLLKGIVIGTILSAILLLGNNLIKFFEINSISDYKTIFDYYHTGAQFSKPLGFHPTYLGVFYMFSCVIISTNLSKVSPKLKNLGVLSLFCLLIAIVFLNSRIIYFFAALLTLVVGVIKIVMLFKVNKLKGILYIVIVITLMVFGFNGMKKTYINQRVTKELKWDLSRQVGTSYSGKLKGDSRVARWCSSLTVFLKKPWIGYGMGNEKNVLGKQFLKDELKYSYKNEYDSHNEYLSTLIEFGLFGGVLLLAFFLSNLWLAISMKNVIFMSFIVLVMGVCFFENYLSRNAGILFVALFSSVLGRYDYLINTSK